MSNDNVESLSEKEIKKQKKKAYNKAYYQKNKEKKKAYYQKNKEEIKEKRKEYQKEWYEKNKEQKKEYQKEWYEKNKEQKKAYRLKNKEKINEYQNEYQNEYRLKNKEKIIKRIEVYRFDILSGNRVPQRHHTPETKSKLSLVMCKKMQENPGMFSGKNCFKKGYFKSKKCIKEVYYRSSYELLYLQLIEKDPDVESFLSESITIPFVYKGIDCYTVPDLLITMKDGIIKLVEIKSQGRLKEFSKERDKVEAYKQYAKDNGYQFELMTEKELVEYSQRLEKQKESNQ
ncbi:hypothetical protein M0R19_03705 [Candidatus Pacearchaeota archaeon]|nr:hypothetical protein [Candidatus Pacearchaeota archaeon]